jgi:hypothetical protein
MDQKIYPCFYGRWSRGMRKDGYPSCLTYFGSQDCCCGGLECSSISLSTLLESLRCKFMRRIVTVAALGEAY